MLGESSSPHPCLVEGDALLHEEVSSSSRPSRMRQLLQDEDHVPRTGLARESDAVSIRCTTWNKDLVRSRAEELRESKVLSDLKMAYDDGMAMECHAWPLGR